MSARSILKSLVLTAAVIGAPVLASAGTMTVAQQNPLSVFGDNGHMSVRIYDPVLPATGRATGAGAFDLVASPAQSFTDAAGNFTAFCLDIVGNLHLPRGYTETVTPFAAKALTALQRSNVNKLFNTAYATLNIADNAQSAGFQLALWEIVNETSGTFDAAAGTFYGHVTITNSAAFTAANAFLGGLGGPVTGKYGVHYLQADYTYSRDGSLRSGQDLVTVSPVPLPAAGWMLIFGIGALAVSRRRKQA